MHTKGPLSRASMQHETKISITFASTNNLQPWDFCHPASNIARRPTSDPKLIVAPSLGNHLTLEWQLNCLFPSPTSLNLIRCPQKLGCIIRGHSAKIQKRPLKLTYVMDTRRVLETFIGHIADLKNRLPWCSVT